MSGKWAGLLNLSNTLGPARRPGVFPAAEGVSALIRLDPPTPGVEGSCRRPDVRPPMPKPGTGGGGGIPDVLRALPRNGGFTDF